MYVKLSEKDKNIITSTDRQRLFSAVSHVSDEKRKRWLMLVTVMIEIAKWPQMIGK